MRFSVGLALVIAVSLSSGQAVAAGTPASSGDAWCAELTAVERKARAPREAAAEPVPTLARADYEVDLIGNVAVGRLVMRYTPSEPDLEARLSYAVPAGLELTSFAVNAGSISHSVDGSEARTYKAPASDIRIRGGETIEVTAAFRDTLSFENGRFVLELPGVQGRCKAGESARGRTNSRPAPVPVGILLTLHHDAPLELDENPADDVRVVFEGSRTRVSATTSGGRPFRFGYALGASDESALSGFAGREANGARNVQLVLAPPTSVSPGAVRPKEVLFALDTSGSMGGVKLDQARAALKFCLNQLRPDDRFNVVAFDSHVTALKQQPTKADPYELGRSESWLDARRAEGGTALIPALEALFAQPTSPAGQDEPERLRLVIVLTDGRVVDEAAVARFLEESIGKARLFFVGVGAPAEFAAILRLAEYGRGTAAFAADPTSLDATVRKLFAEVSTPVAWDLTLDWGGAEVDLIEPARLPDLYAGRPVVVRARVRGELPDRVLLRATTMDGPRELTSAFRVLEDLAPPER